MRAVHRAAPRGHGRGAHLVDPEHLECGCGADDVDDGVVPTDLVEVHLVDRATVQVGLDGRQRAEDGQGALGHPRRERGVLDHRPDRSVGAADVVTSGDDHPRAGDASAPAFFDPKVPAREGKAVEHAADLLDVGTGVDERAEGHVTGDAGEAVEPGHPDVRSVRRHGSNRAMAQAAPYPLSMPTTVMPDEQAESMVSSAVTPSSAAP